MKKSVRSLAALLVLAGGLALSAGGCASTPTRKSTGEFIDDANITGKIKANFAKDPGVKMVDINVDTFKGNVQLSGFVNTAEEKTRAEQLARGVHGVVNVTNNLQVKGQPVR